MLVATFAAAVYANHLWLIPRLWSRRRFDGYAAALLLVMGLLALACTAAIHVVYDVLWGPTRHGSASWSISAWSSPSWRSTSSWSPSASA